MIEVFVCVPQGAEPLPECLGALAGAEVRVVHAPSVWQARQAALVQAEQEVLAFVDGDVVVDPGWADALDAAWAAANWEIGAIGGPIAPLSADGGTRSRAVADTIDWGEGPLDVDPLERTLPGGNLSFRRRALLGVGGFEPTVDGRDARDWLAEEHEAQRQLGHWGWLLRYDPRLRAVRAHGWRAAPRGGRLRYGIRLGGTRARTTRAALRAFARAVAGVPVAAARRNAGLRSERTDRAAENAGVILGAIAGHMRDRPEPAPRSVPGPQRRPATARPAAPFILLYHRVASASADPLRLCVTPAHFEQHVEVLQRDFSLVSMDEMAADRPAGAVAITFDDGYADNLAALRDLDVPVTLYAATGHVAEGRPFFWDELTSLVLAERGDPPARIQVRIGEELHEWPTQTPAQRSAALGALHRRLQPGSAETIEAVLTQVRQWAGASAAQSEGGASLMTVDELCRLARTGVTIGAHTSRHLNLAHQPAGVVRAEVEGSRDAVAAWTGTRPRGFSYPFGIPRHDVDSAARQTVREAGFEYGVVNQPTPVTPEADRYALPRLFAPDVGAAELLSRLRPIVS